MLPEWLESLPELLTGTQAAILVTVARTEGSTPREIGAAMLATESRLAGTIGGGHLEWQALKRAHDMLQADTPEPALIRYSLGASLGQCCGGVVWLLFEYLPATSSPQWISYRQSVQQGNRLYRTLQAGQTRSAWALSTSGQYGNTLSGNADAWQFCQEIETIPFPIYIFGAGHVARALVQQLGLLHADITLIDSREEAFEEINTGTLHAVITDAPEEEVMKAPAGTYFIVLTHSHAQDFAICEQIFRRQDFAYFGLIGSASKRATFEHRLLDRGLSKDRLEEMTCPIGIPGITGKEPEVIALSVAAQLLQLRDARRLAARPRASVPLSEVERS